MNPFAATSSQSGPSKSLFSSTSNQDQPQQPFPFSSALSKPPPKGSNIFGIPIESQTAKSDKTPLFGHIVSATPSGFNSDHTQSTRKSTLFEQPPVQQSPLFGNSSGALNINSNQFTNPSMFAPPSKSAQTTSEGGKSENTQTSPVDISMTSPDVSPSKPAGSAPIFNPPSVQLTQSPPKQSNSGRSGSPTRSIRSFAHPLSHSTSIEDIKPQNKPIHKPGVLPTGDGPNTNRTDDPLEMSNSELGRVYALQATPREVSHPNYMSDGMAGVDAEEANKAMTLSEEGRNEISARLKGEFVDEIELPNMPNIFNQEEQLEFNRAYQMQILKDSCAYAVAAAPPSTDLTAIIEFYNSRVQMIQHHGKISAPKRKADEAAHVDISTPTKRSKATTGSQSAPPKVKVANTVTPTPDRKRIMPKSGGNTTPTEKGSKRKAEVQLTKDDAEKESDRDRFLKKSRVQDAGHTPIAPRTRLPPAEKPMVSISKPTTSKTTNVFKNILRKAADETASTSSPSTPTPSSTLKEPPAPNSIFGTNANRSAAATSNTPTKNPEPSTVIKPPTFTISGTDFMSQFGKKAELSTAAEKAKRKAEDFDSDDETVEEWERRYDEEQQAKKQKMTTEAPKAVFTLDPTLKPTGLFGSLAKESSPSNAVSKPAPNTNLFGSISSSSTKESSSAAPPRSALTTGLFGSSSGSTLSTSASSTIFGASVFDSPKLRAEVKLTSTDNIFGHLSANNSQENSKVNSPAGGSDNGNDGDHSGDESPSTEDEDEDEDEVPDANTNGSGNSGEDTEDTSKDDLSEENITQTWKANPFAMQGSSTSSKLNLGSSIFGTGMKNGVSESSATKPQARSLFDRIERDEKGEPLRESPSPLSFPQDSTKNTDSPNGNPSVFDTSKASSTNLFGSAATSKTPTFNFFGSQGAASGDNTWKPNTPIKFRTPDGPDINITAASPVKATPGGKSISSPPRPSLFGTGAPSSVGFAFGGPPKSAVPQSLFLSAGNSSGVSSRGSSPGATTDTGGESANDSAADAKDENAAGEVSEDKSAASPATENERVLFKSKAKAHVFDKDVKNWVTRGLGMIYILKTTTEKDDGKTRMVFKVRPGGGIALNTHVLVDGKYESKSAKGVNFIIPAKEGFESWLLSLANAELAKEAVEILKAVQH
jgi:hypothetical protein